MILDILTCYWPMSNPLALSTVSLVYLIRYKQLTFRVNATKKMNPQQTWQEKYGLV